MHTGAFGEVNTNTGEVVGVMMEVRQLVCINNGKGTRIDV